MSPRDECRRVLAEIRRLIKGSPFSQRQVESRAGFSRGYLSQLLAENLDLKFVHIIAILGVLEIDPGRFFGALFPGPRRDALAHFGNRSRLGTATDLHRDLDRLYDAGLESLQGLRARLERCERAVTRLEDMGVLPQSRRARGGTKES